MGDQTCTSTGVCRRTLFADIHAHIKIAAYCWHRHDSLCDSLFIAFRGLRMQEPQHVQGKRWMW